MRKIILSTIVMLSAFSLTVFAAAPAITAVSYDENSNILRIDFAGNIWTSADKFNIGGLSFDDDNGGNNPDVTLNGGVIMNSGMSANYIEIRLYFTGNIGTYTLTDDPKTYYTWGTVYSALEALEKLENKSGIKMLVRENTYLGVNNDSNDEIGLLGASLVSYTADADLPELIYANYDAGFNKLTVAFDKVMQWDSQAEDRMLFWTDTLGVEHHDPGNGLLNAGEDLNDNGVLDFEANVRPLSITVTDDSGAVVALSGGAVVETQDNDTLTLALLIDNYKAIEDNLDAGSLKINFPIYTFQSDAYNPAPATAEFAVSYTADTDLCIPDSAIYNMGTNEFKVWFTNPLITNFYAIPKFSITVGTETVVLEGYSITPTITNPAGVIKIPLSYGSQEEVEALINSNPGMQVYVNVEPFAVKDSYGNGNEAVTNLSCIVEPESGSNKAPEVVSADYDAETNILAVEFDVNLKQFTEFVNITGFSLLNDGDTLTFANSELGISGNNKIIWLEVPPEDELAIESVTDKNAFYLLLEPFSVYQNPKMNGNWAVTAADMQGVTYNGDTTSPLPNVVKFNASTGNIVLQFNEAMALFADFTKFQFAGLTLTGNGVSYGLNPAELLLGLTTSDIAALDGLSGEMKDSVTVTIASAAFMNADSVDIDLSTPVFMDNDTLTAGAEYSTPLVGIGRDFWLKSKEAFPTVDRSIPATIRKFGPNCIIYVADDQWREYEFVDIFGEVNETNGGRIPTTQAEVDAVYDHFVGTGETYYQINELLASGKENKIPPVVTIFMCDILDEYNLGRNDSNRAFWVGSFFNVNDQSSEWEAGGEFNTNELDMVYLDTWPQLFSSADSSWYWYESGTTLEWRQNRPAALGGTMEVTGMNALDNGYAKLLSYKVDPWESQWLVEGLASFAEFYIDGSASFCGAGNPTTPTADAIKNLSTGLKTRVDYFNTYLFVLYLYEKFGGVDFIKNLAVAPTVDMGSIDAVFSSMLADPSAGTPEVRERWTNFASTDVFSYYAMACLLDTTNMDFAVSDPVLEEDDYMFRFDNINLYGVISNKNATIMKWNELTGPPPYYLDQETWSFNYYYSTFNPLAGLTNPTIAATKAFGASVAMSDTSRINVLLPFDSMNFFELLLKNEAVATQNNPNFYFHYFPYDTVNHGFSFPVSPDTGWSLVHYEEMDASGTLGQVGEYKSIVLVGVLGGSGKITQATLPPALYYLSAAQNPIMAGRFDIYLVVSDEVWGDGTANADVPKLFYTAGADTTVLAMTPYIFNNAFGYTGDYSMYNSYLNLTTEGNYQIWVQFTDLSGEVFTLGPEGFVIDNYVPGGSAAVGLDGAYCVLNGNSYSQPFNLSMQKFERNAEAGEAEQFLYSQILFAAPPSEALATVGPAYSIEPGFTLEEPAELTLPYGNYIGIHSPSELGIYIYRNGGWDYIGGTVNTNNQTITVRSKQLGLVQIMAGEHPVIPADLAIPDRYSLEQNYPNPFNPTTQISYQLPFGGNTTLKVYDVTGRETAVLVDSYQPTGYYTVRWDGHSGDKAAASGVYFYRLESGKFRQTGKMILVK